MMPTLQVEYQILASCLTVSGATREVVSIIQKVDTFTTPVNQKIYAAVLSLHNDAQETDLVTVHNELIGQHGYLRDEPTGWMELLTSILPESDRLTTNLARLCFWLIEETTRATLMKLYSRAITDLQIPGNDPLSLMKKVQEQQDSITNRINELSETPFSDSLIEAARLAEQASKTKDPITGIKTGLYDLDKMFKGLHGSTFTIMGARPAMGKTAELVQICYNIAYQQRIPVVVFSLEMKRLQMARRLLSLDTEIKNAEVLSGLNKFNDPIDIKQLFDSAGRLSQAPLFIYDKIFSLDHIVAKSRQLVQNQGVKAIFIDYIQLIETSDRDDRSRVSRASRKLKNLSNELDVPVVGLAQLTRDVDKRDDKRPRISDLKESGSLEQDADNIFFLYRPGYYSTVDKDGNSIPFDLLYNIVTKNRHGSTHNDKEGIELRYDMATNRIKDWR